MNSRIIRKEQTREAIMKTAHALFSRYGFLKVTTAAIAKNTKISHGAVFAHFPVRDDLVMAVVNQFGETTVRRMHDLAEAQQSLETVLNAHLVCIGENEFFYSNLIRDLPALPVLARHCLIAIQSGISYHIYKAADIAIREKRIKPIAPDLFFNTWIGLIHHYLMNRELFVTGESVSIIETYGKKLLEHFMNVVSLSYKEE